MGKTAVKAAPEVVLSGDAGDVKPNGKTKTEFAKRNPNLEKFVPDAIENFVDKLLPDDVEAKMDETAKAAVAKFAEFKVSFDEGFGEIAGVLFKVAKYAASRFNIGDVVFGVYHLSEHHNTQGEIDAVKGTPVTDPDLLKWLLYCTDIAVMTYCPTKEQLCAAVEIPPEDVVIFQPKADARRPAYAVCLDHQKKNVIWTFRGTTDLADMLTDVCGVCTPYLDGYSHWGMLSAAEWFATNELQNVRDILDKHPGYNLVLTGHSLGAGTACLLAHWVKNKPEAAEIMKGIDVKAVGVATPAVLTADMAEGCKDYISTVVLMHDVVPRFSIKNMFDMKQEMDDTKWGDILAERLKDWLVPDDIEKSATYQRLARRAHSRVGRAFNKVVTGVVNGGLAVGAFFVNTYKKCPCVKPEVKGEGDDIVPPPSGRTTPGTLADKARVMAGERAKRKSSQLDDAPGLVAQAGLNQMNKVRDAGDIHDVFAPGRIFFITRKDREPTPSEVAEEEAAIDAEIAKQDEKKGPKRTSTDRLALVGEGADVPEMSPEEAEAAAAAKEAAAKALQKRRDAARKKIREEKKKAKEEAKKKAYEEIKKAAEAAGEEVPPEPTEDPYPGATFEMIEAAPGERFRRIVLRDTCVQDHMCDGYIQGLEYVLKKLDPTVEPPVVTPAVAANAGQLPEGAKDEGGKGKGKDKDKDKKAKDSKK